MFGFLETRNETFSNSLFALFWHSRYQEAYDFFNKSLSGTLDTRWFSIENLANAFVSAYCSGNDVDTVLKFYPKPLERWELAMIKEYQCCKEKTTPRNGQGLLAQPAVIYKALLAAQLGIENGATHFVETGTFCGTSCYLLANCFEALATVEAQPQLAESARTLYEHAGLKNVTAYQGNSAEILSKLDFKTTPDKVVFFLDAHFSSGPTSQSFGTCPLLGELAILFQRFHGSTIIIDDMRCMTGSNGFPHIYQILAGTPGDYSARIQYDQMILTLDK